MVRTNRGRGVCPENFNCGLGKLELSPDKILCDGKLRYSSFGNILKFLEFLEIYKSLGVG